MEAALERGDQPSARLGPVDEDPEYKARAPRDAPSPGAPAHPPDALVLSCAQLIVDCNSLTVDIDNEVVQVHNFIRDKCVRYCLVARGRHPFGCRG